MLRTAAAFGESAAVHRTGNGAFPADKCAGDGVRAGARGRCTAGVQHAALRRVSSASPSDREFLTYSPGPESEADATGPLPANPEHGPWRRQFGLALGTDLRTSGSSGDVDADGTVDAIDNCLYRPNPNQQDTGGFGSANIADGIGDVCQCGNVAGDGRVAADDVLAYRQSLANPAGAPLSAAAQTRCVVIGTGTACNVLQVSAIRRALAVPALPPLTSASVAQVCAAAKP
jgi:hypothetical protein